MDADTQVVINKVTVDGTIDEIRRKVVDELKQDEGLKKMVFDLVENSQALSSSENLKLNKRQLLEVLRKELEQDLMDHASQAAWKIMSSQGSIVSAYIDQKVHEALCTVYQERRQQQQAADSTSAAAAAGYGAPYETQVAYGTQYIGYGSQPGGTASSQAQPAYALAQAYQAQYAQQYSAGVYAQPQQVPAQGYGAMYAQAAQQHQYLQQQYSQQPHRGK